MERLVKEKNAFIFQGAGTVYRKYLGSLTEQHLDLLKNNCAVIRRASGIDLWRYIINGIPEDEEELLEQLAVYAVNCTIYEIYLQYGIYPYIISGFSMGIYSALACGGAVTFNDGAALLTTAYNFMKESMEGRECAMASIIGLERKELEEIIEKSGCGDTVEIACENNFHCYTLSGLKEGVEKAAKTAGEEGALKVVRIQVSFPCHTGFLEKAAGRFAHYLDSMPVRQLTCPLIACTDQKLIENPADIKEELHKNLKSNISWLNAINRMGRSGSQAFIEVGLGNSLSKVSELINKDYVFYGYKNVRQ
jgi:[acyl-carrier-protein] S-malonyltransferase